jgi:hypothetical protein
MKFNKMLHHWRNKCRKTIGFRISVLAFTLFSATWGIAQNPVWVQNIIDDCSIETTLEISHSMISTDSSMWSILPYSLRNQLNVEYFSGVYLDTLENGVEHVRLTTFGTGHSRFFGGNTFDLFFKNENILMVVQSYVDNSRMGSCGHIEIRNQAFFRNNQIEYIESFESPFRCYENPVDSSLLFELGTFFLEYRSQIPFALFLQEIERYKKEINYKQEIGLPSSRSKNQYVLKWVKPLVGQPTRPAHSKPTPLSSFKLLYCEFIGDRYVLGRVNGGEPTGFMHYTMYYFERPEANKEEGK